MMLKFQVLYILPTIRINNRKVLKGFFRNLGIEDSTMILRSVDKLGKIGIENVRSELSEFDLSEDVINQILEFISIKGSNGEIVNNLKSLNIEDEIFIEGVNELEVVSRYIGMFGVPEENYQIDLTISRGLDYYTGTVYETFLNDYPSIGSVCSGGRYDDLATYYTTQKLPGVGISIGLTRLFYQLREANIIESKDNSLTKVVIIPMEGYMDYAIEALNSLRKANIYSQVYFEDGKTGKKFKFANNLNIPYTIAIGKDEVDNNKYTLKNMITGEQSLLSIEEVIDKLK